MPDPFLSELKLVAFNFAPKGWSLCNGQLQQINQNQALFSLLGTTYGGDGQRTFALPDLRQRVPISQGGGYVIGEKGGEVNHTLTTSEMPTHIHFLQGVGAAENLATPGGNLLANTSASLPLYGPPTSLVNMHPSDVSNFGGSQPHSNQSPFLVMTWIIALQGIFPSQN